jgi:hypothetical protein
MAGLADLSAGAGVECGGLTYDKTNWPAWLGTLACRAHAHPAAAGAVPSMAYSCTTAEYQGEATAKTRVGVIALPRR